MKILMFGMTGQVAREMTRRVPTGVSLRAVGREEADLTDAAACAGVIDTADADVVVNAAAYTDVDRAETEEALADAVNGVAPTAMARAAARRGLPFLHISTEYVFDGSGDTPWRPDSPTAPLGAYGRSKLKGEQGVLAAGGAHAVLRTSWVFSAHGSNFVTKVLRQGLERRHICVVCDQIGGPTCATDIADGLFVMAGHFRIGKDMSGIHHLAGAPDISRADFARRIFEAAGMDATVEDVPSSRYATAARRPLNCRLDCSELANRFGMKRPRWNLSLDKVLKEIRKIETPP